jgi:hypothetical protein
MCYSYKCPTCRETNTLLISGVNNTVMLKGLLRASQEKLKDIRELNDLE